MPLSSTANSDGIVINELLCFIQNKLDVLPVDSISQLCVSTFCESDIEEAKKLLYDTCSDKTSTRFKKRQGVNKSHANIADIIRLLQEIGDDVPQYAALNLAKLPPISLEVHNSG